MIRNPYTLRFQVGKAYRFHTSRSIPYRGGSFTVKAELKPADQWGNRILLVDAVLTPREDGEGKTELLGAKCFVEEGYTEFRDSYGVRTMPVEVATLQGIYPERAKAYANAEVRRGGFTTITPANRVA